MRFCLLVLLLTAASAQERVPPYRDPRLSVEQRVADLLSRMTLEEKVAQTQALWQKKALIMDEKGQFAPAKAAAVLRHGMGQITRPSEKKGPREMAEFTNAIQRWVIENTRLGIPVMFHEECLHGHAAPKGTHFPQAIALASTWNPALVEEVFTAVAREVRARGARQATGAPRRPSNARIGSHRRKARIERLMCSASVGRERLRRNGGPEFLLRDGGRRRMMAA